jgi:FkbM family methyltransferase
MAFTSYAQNFEDVILWHALEFVPNGYYVDVGAGHPEYLSVTKAFYDRGWSGINIEPQAEMIALLREQRPRDINLHTTAGPTIGSALFYNFDKGVGVTSTKLAVRKYFEDRGHSGHVAELGQTTLNHVLETYAPKQPIHFLKIDVEGYEAEVLEGLDLKRYRPWIVVAEAVLYWTRVDHEWDHHLLDNHYQYAYFDGQNTYYIAVEAAKGLRSRLGIK